MKAYYNQINLTSLIVWLFKSHIQHFVRLYLFLVQLDKQSLQNVFPMIFTLHTHSRVAGSITINWASNSGSC